MAYKKCELDKSQISLHPDIQLFKVAATTSPGPFTVQVDHLWQLV